MNLVDSILNKFTMYKVVMYGLFILVAYSLLLSFVGILSFKPLELIATLLILIFSAYFINLLLAKMFKVYPNSESSIITALILYFLLWPSAEISGLLIILTASFIAMLSKYVVSYKHKHLFNPAALAAVIIIFLNSGAIWWIATPLMLIPATIIGLGIVRKIRKLTMFFTFLVVSVFTFISFTVFKGKSVIDELLLFFYSFPVIFLGTVMLTEPLTTPPTKKLQMIYAGIVGFIFSLQTPIGHFYPTPEVALLFGNIFSFVVSPKYRLKLKLLEKIDIAKDTLEIVMEKPKNFKFLPGQYLEWTLPTAKTDLRGNRRYFTISSSPTEDNLRLGIKLNNPSSSFKDYLKKSKAGDFLFAGTLSGDFTLKNNKKLVFIAGGIGITPFRSLIKYLFDKNDKREIVLFYSSKSVDEIAYKTFLGEASQKLNLKVVYVVTDEKAVPKNFNGETGRINREMLNKYLNDLNSYDFYLSGPIAMVNSYKKLLKSLRVKSANILTDYFPGF